MARASAAGRDHCPGLGAGRRGRRTRPPYPAVPSGRRVGSTAQSRAWPTRPALAVRSTRPATLPVDAPAPQPVRWHVPVGAPHKESRLSAGRVPGGRSPQRCCRTAARTAVARAAPVVVITSRPSPLGGAVLASGPARPMLPASRPVVVSGRSSRPTRLANPPGPSGGLTLLAPPITASAPPRGRSGGGAVQGVPALSPPGTAPGPRGPGPPPRPVGGSPIPGPPVVRPSPGSWRGPGCRRPSPGGGGSRRCARAGSGW